MKTFVFLFAAMIGSTGISFAQHTDFRDFTWGNSLSDVQSSEKSPLVVTVGDDEVIYKDILGGSDCNVYYIFNDNNKLESGMYVFTKKYSNPQLYLQDYTKFKDLLTQKYGKPDSEKEVWATITTPLEKHNYGQAIADGNLSLNTVWNTNRTTVKIVLIASDRHPSLQIQYITKSLNELENEDELKAALKKL